MNYDSEADEYTYQQNKKLWVLYTGSRQSKSGYESEVTYFECESCEVKSVHAQRITEIFRFIDFSAKKDCSNFSFCYSPFSDICSV